MEVGLGPNWGCRAKEKKKDVFHVETSRYLQTVLRNFRNFFLRERNISEGRETADIYL
jgi:hypothetical protein